MALRRERERQAVLAEAVAEIRGKGRPEFKMADLFMDFKSIQVTLAVMMRALINGRIDCKTAGKLMVDLQTMSKLLRTHNKKARALPLINTDNTGPRDRTTEKPSLVTEPWRAPFHQDRAGIVDDHEDGGESRNKVVAKSPGNAASATNAQILAIRSVEQPQSPFHALQRHGSRPALLTG